MVDASLVHAVTGVLTCVYIIGIEIPSLILNGLIVFTFIKTKELHTPSNLLSVHVCIIGLVVSTFCFPVTVTAFTNVMILCDCSIFYYHWFIGRIIFSSLYPLNILLLTISYLLILKFSSSVLTFYRTLASLIIIWIVATLGNLPIILFVINKSTFVECCESVCLNETSLCNNTISGTFTPHRFNLLSRMFFLTAGIVFILLPSLLVFFTSAASYYVYRRSVVKSKVVLEVRMLLLPVLMTFSIAIFILSQDVVNWQRPQICTSDLPGVFAFVLMGLLRDINGVYFSVLILFFNVNLRKSCYQLLAKLMRTQSIFKWKYYSGSSNNKEKAQDIDYKY